MRAFGDWPTVLDIPRDHGGQPPKTIETRNGRRVRVQPDGSLTAVDVIYDVQPIEDGHAVNVSAGDMKTMRQLLRRAQKDFRHFDPATAEQHLKTIGVEDGDELRMSVDASPPAVLGGVVAALWLYVLTKTGHRLMDWAELKRAIESAQRTGWTFRYLTSLPGLCGPDVRFGHKLVVRSTPKGELIGYVELCGVLKIGGVFARRHQDGPVIEHIYAYDLQAQKDRSAEFSINALEFEEQDWRTIGLGPTDGNAVGKLVRDAQEAVLVPTYAARFGRAAAEKT